MTSIQPPKPVLIKSSRVLLSFLFTGAVLAFIIIFTTPERLGPIGVTGFFILSFLFILSALELLYRRLVATKKYWPFWLRMMYAALPVLLLALSSLRQLSMLDIIVAISLAAMVNVYHNRHLG